MSTTLPTPLPTPTSITARPPSPGAPTVVPATAPERVVAPGTVVPAVVMPGAFAPPPAAPAPGPSAMDGHAERSAGLRHGLIGRLRADQRGEGVISAAIAVLIMAFVGVGAFVAYRGIMSSVTAKTTECVNVYVSNGSGCE